MLFIVLEERRTSNAEDIKQSNDYDDGNVHGYGHVQIFTCVALILMILCRS